MHSPRFVVCESRGFRITDRGGGQARHQREVTEVMVLDRCYCHRVVWSSETALLQAQYKSFSRPNPHRNKVWRISTKIVTARKRSLAWRREYAETLAARLNAEHEAWLADA